MKIEVKMLEAEGLKPSGFSLDRKTDPYCVIECGKESVKTKKKRATLRPKWNETFVLGKKHTFTERDMLVFRVFDDDVVGAHQIGAARLPIALLRPDGMPEMETVALTKSLKKSKRGNPKSCGQVKIQWKRLYDEGEKKRGIVKMSASKRNLLRSGELPFGTLRVCIHEARRLHAADKGNTSDPYCVVRVGKEKHTSKHVEKTLDPLWDNASFVFGKSEKYKGSIFGDESVKIKIYDKDDGRFDKDDLLGIASISISALSPSGSWIPITRRKKEAGELLISGNFKQNEISVQADDGTQSGTDRVVTIRVLEAKDLPAADRNKSSDPYCLLEYKGQELKTTVQKKTLHPFWESNVAEEFTLERTIEEGEEYGKLSINVFDWDRFGKDDFLGSTTVDLDATGLEINQEGQIAWYALTRPRPSAKRKGEKRSSSWGFRRGKSRSKSDSEAGVGKEEMEQCGEIRMEILVTGPEPRAESAPTDDDKDETLPEAPPVVIPAPVKKEMSIETETVSAPTLHKPPPGADSAIKVTALALRGSGLVGSNGAKGKMVVSHGGENQECRWHLGKDEIDRDIPEANVSAATLSTAFNRRKSLSIVLFCGKEQTHSLRIPANALLSSRSLLQWFTMESMNKGNGDVDVNLYVEVPDVDLEAIPARNAAHAQLAASREIDSFEKLSNPVPSVSPANRYPSEDARVIITEKELRTLIQEAAMDSDGRMDLGELFDSFDATQKGELGRDGMLCMLRELGVSDILLEQELDNILTGTNFPAHSTGSEWSLPSEDGRASSRTIDFESFANYALGRDQDAAVATQLSSSLRSNSPRRQRSTPANEEKMQAEKRAHERAILKKLRKIEQSMGSANTEKHSSNLFNTIYTSIHGGEPTHSAENLLRDGGSADWPHPVGGWTALHIAAGAGQAGVVMWLIQNGADPCSYDEFGKLAEQYAMESGHMELARALRSIRMKALLGETNESAISAPEPDWFDPQDDDADLSVKADMEEMQSTLVAWKEDVKRLWKKKHASTKRQYLGKMEELHRKLGKERSKRRKVVEELRYKVGRMEGKLEDLESEKATALRDSREKMQHIRALTEQLDRCRQKLLQIKSGISPLDVSVDVDKAVEETKVEKESYSKKIDSTIEASLNEVKQAKKKKKKKKSGRKEEKETSGDTDESNKLVFGLNSPPPRKCAPCTVM